MTTEQPDSPLVERLASILRSHDEGLDSRNNRAAALLPLVQPHLRAAVTGAVRQAPAPICVQLQVSASCATRCVMCDQWRRQLDPADALDGNQWRALLEELRSMGVGSLVLSGGEPLMRPDIVEFTRYAKELGFAIGMFTSGSSLDDAVTFARKIHGLRDLLSWASVSVDGLPVSDAAIRRPMETDRSQRLQSLCEQWRGTMRLDASVTLQQRNIDDDLASLIRTLHGWGFENVNAKLATGAEGSTGQTRRQVLIAEARLHAFVDALYEEDLRDMPGSNLGYLRRCFASGIFTVEDAAAGAPVKTFYEKGRYQCVTAYLFALVDIDGGVFPCCHLFRDNHGTDPQALATRSQHQMGRFPADGGFAAIWNGERYGATRTALETIEPAGAYSPCGECTRHCQPNAALNALLPLVREHGEVDFTAPPTREALGLPAGNAPAWL